MESQSRMYSKHSIGNNFREKRIERNLSQSELSKLSGVSQPMISSIERDKYIPSVITAQKIAKALRCTVDEFLSESE